MCAGEGVRKKVGGLGGGRGLAEKTKRYTKHRQRKDDIILGYIKRNLDQLYASAKNG